MTDKNKTESDKPDLSRRKFGQRATLAGAAAVFTTGRIFAESPQHEEPASEENQEVEARFQRVMQRYGDRLTLEQKTRIRKILSFNEKLLEPIRNFALENGNAPATEFKLYSGAVEKPHNPVKEQA